jgi:para-aminobenzoate synthetase/4-amino-4-deoxychorismate lyase
VNAPPALSGDRRRPDPALGVFTTLRVRDGVPERLDAHLERLSRSVLELYGERLADVEIPNVDGAVRIVFVPGQGVRVQSRPLTRRELPIVLTPYVLPGGLGAHKWVDRRLVDALGGTPLFLDADGTVLEAGWASVLVRRDGRLLTPRTDGRILPSTSRPDAEEADIRLQPGDELFLSSATSGVVPAVLAGTSPARPGDRSRTPLRTGA